jgi:hypothetical protein
MKPLAFFVLAVLLGVLPITVPDVSAQTSTRSPTDKPAQSTARTTGSAATAGSPYKCDPNSGICYCTGGPTSADCKKLGGSTDCGQKFGCDGSGRCFCIPKAPAKW